MRNTTRYIVAGVTMYLHIRFLIDIRPRSPDPGREILDPFIYNFLFIPFITCGGIITLLFPLKIIADVGYYPGSFFNERATGPTTGRIAGPGGLMVADGKGGGNRQAGQEWNPKADRLFVVRNQRETLWKNMRAKCSQVLV
jgi:hypothetical protein